MEENRKKTPAVKPLIDLLIVIVICVAAFQLSPTVRGILFETVYNASPQIAIKYLADKDDIVTAKELLQYEQGELRGIDISRKKTHFYGIFSSWKDTISLLAYPGYVPENDGEARTEGSQTQTILFNDNALSVSAFYIDDRDKADIQAEPGYVEVEGYIGSESKDKITLRVTGLKNVEYDDVQWEEGQIISKEDFEPDHVVEVHKQIGENGKYVLETIEFCRLGATFWYASSGEGTEYSIGVQTADGREAHTLNEWPESSKAYQFVPRVRPSASLDLEYDMVSEDDGRISSTGETFELSVDAL